jgi:hypothetical protein
MNTFIRKEKKKQKQYNTLIEYNIIGEKKRKKKENRSIRLTKKRRRYISVNNMSYNY